MGQQGIAEACRGGDDLTMGRCSANLSALGGGTMAAAAMDQLVALFLLALLLQQQNQNSANT